MLITYLNVLAWTGAILSTLLVIVRFIAYLDYDEIDQMHDAMRGVRRTYPIAYPGSIAVICWSWVVATFIV